MSRDQMQTERGASTGHTAKTHAALGCVGAIVVLILSSCTNAGPAVRGRNQSWFCLKQIAMALHGYHEEFGSFPPPANYDGDGRPLLSWRVLILPYLELEGMKALYAQFHLNEPWDSPNNLPLVQDMPVVYRYPTGASSVHRHTNYLAVTGEGTAFPPQHTAKLSEITDGADRTVMVIEVGPSTVTWTKPEDLVLDGGFPLPAKIGSPFPGSRFVLLANGVVEIIQDNIDPKVWRSLMTIHGGELVNDDEF